MVKSWGCRPHGANSGEVYRFPFMGVLEDEALFFFTKWEEGDSFFNQAVSAELTSTRLEETKLEESRKRVRTVGGQR